LQTHPQGFTGRLSLLGAKLLFLGAKLLFLGAKLLFLGAKPSWYATKIVCRYIQIGGVAGGGR
jgi:hypothetical protein